MKYNPAIHHRRSIRLKGYDYAQAGAYYVTIVTQNRACLFGEIVNGEMRLNSAGHIAQQEWRRLGQRFTNIQLEAFVVMPNHIHGILTIRAVGATRQGQPGRPFGKDSSQTKTLFDEGGSPLPDDEGGSPLPDDGVGSPQPGGEGGSSQPDNDRASPRTPNAPGHPNGPAPGSLGAILGQFKSRVTKRLWTHPGLHETRVWQRNYYEHIIRNDDEHKRIHLYIASNPANWMNDDENPLRLK